MFKQMESLPNLPEFEKEIASSWRGLNIVEKLKESRKGSEKKVYIDGPITANNYPHYGHAVTWTLKDIVPRYWSMKNYFVSRNMGWDCQGLPVELEVEKDLGFKEKDDIKKFGIAKFNDLCKQAVFKYRDSIFEYESKLGRWFDDTDVYYTMNKDFIESIWWSFKELYNKGLIYKGFKVVPYSTRAGCALSHNEVADGGYQEVEDTAITVKFKVKKMENTYFLAWTTTTWTIPGNIMLAGNRTVQYVKVESEGSFYILAKSRLEPVFREKPYKIVEELNFKDIEGLEYEAVYPYYEEKRSEGCFIFVHADHANDEDGTGIVHLAPYGEEDFNVFMNKGIRIFDYLDDNAYFTDAVSEYAGMFYKDANVKILEDLDKKGALFFQEKITHRVGICYRTKTPLIYKPIESWYLAVTKIKDKMLEQNDGLNWVPEHLREGLSKVWIAGARDWALSRSRYWGTPVPVWVNDKTGEEVVIGSFEEIKEKSGVTVEDPHRPYVDEITWSDGNGGTFRRIVDVLDVWYDSGSVPFAKLHYPFENKELFNEIVPADYIAEGMDQVRLWFYTMHILGVALFGKVPYKNVVTNGMMLDKNGKKLSKSSRNFAPMSEVLDVYGGDILRLFILTSPIVQGESARFSTDVLDEFKREFFVPLWNSIRYFLMYADVFEFKPTDVYPETSNVLDKWILARLQSLINTVTEKMDSYLLMQASRELIPFVQDLSTWYIRRSRDRIKQGDMESLKTLYYVLSTFSKIIAPMVPFFAEKMYEILDLKSVTNLESVHLDFYPKTTDLSEEQKDLLKTMENTRSIVSSALAIRVSSGVKIRQPLSWVSVTFNKQKEIKFFSDLIMDEVNVKEVKVNAVDEEITDAMGFKVDLNLEMNEDLVVEGNMREFVRKIQDLRKKQGLSVSDRVKVFYEDTAENKKVVEVFSDEIKSKVLSDELIPSEKYEVEKI